VRTDKVSPAPTRGRGVRREQPYKGKITAYDSPIYIADAALYLKATKPDLKITNPYELDDSQFRPRSTCSSSSGADRRVLVGLHQGSAALRERRHRARHQLAGQRNLVTPAKAKVDAIVPKEGSTGWSDTWMISSKAKHPNCMYKWMDWIISPKVNAQVAEWFGEAPAQTKACAETADKIALHDLPRARPGLRRPDLLLDHADPQLRRRPRQRLQGLRAWTQAWTEIKG
jgi:putative spermidine/putrescine transport system substrate-binding protein